VKVTGPNYGYDFKVEKVDTFPKLPELPKKNSVLLGKDILDCLHIATSTTGKNDKWPAQQHVLLELQTNKITVASTDGGYVVFYKEFNHEQAYEEQLLLSLKLIKALEGYIEVSLNFSPNSISFQSGDITIINTKSTHKFPAFRKVFPAEWPPNLKLKRTELLQALDRCALARDQLKQATINLENKQEFELSAKDEIINVNVKITGNYTGNVKSTSVNSEKLLKLINQVDVEEISFAIHDANKAIVLTTEDEGYCALIIPIAIPE
jgi:DNA polymerase III sliding clamp (beta) subunit (PCNA family)